MLAEFSRELPGDARQQAGRCELAPEQPAEMLIGVMAWLCYDMVAAW